MSVMRGNGALPDARRTDYGVVIPLSGYDASLNSEEPEGKAWGRDGALWNIVVGSALLMTILHLAGRIVLEAYEYAVGGSGVDFETWLMTEETSFN